MHSRRQVLSILYNSSFTHAAPVYLGLGDTSLKAATSGGSIKHRTHPLPFTFEERNAIDTGAATLFAHFPRPRFVGGKAQQHRKQKTQNALWPFCVLPWTDRDKRITHAFRLRGRQLTLSTDTLN